MLVAMADLPGQSGFDDRKSPRARSVRARRMAEPGFAIARAAVRVCDDIENDVVRMRRVAGKRACGARNCRLRGGGGHMIKTEEASHAPGDVVVRAGSVSAYAHSADELMAVRIETQAAAKDVYATDFVSNHGVSGGTVVRGRSGVGNASIDRIAVLQSVEAAARLDSRIEVCGGQRQAASLPRATAIGRSVETEGIGGVGLLGGNDPAAGPLGGAIDTGEGDSTNHTVAIDESRPHLVVQAAGFRGSGRSDSVL